MYKCYEPQASCGHANDCHQMRFLTTISATRILIMNLRHRHALPLTCLAFSLGGSQTELEKAAEIKSIAGGNDKKGKQKVKQHTLVKARHTTLMARKICGIFATSSFHFDPPTDFTSRNCCGGHYMLCCIEELTEPVELGIWWYKLVRWPGSLRCNLFLEALHFGIING